MKPLPKLLLAGLIGGGVYLGIQHGLQSGLIPKATVQQSSVPKRAELPRVAEPPPLPAPVAAAPAAVPVSAPVPRAAAIPWEIWAWNGQAGLIAANGGAETTPESLIGKRGRRVRLIRNDDTAQMQANLVTFARALAAGERDPQVGTALVNIMGDGTPAFFAGVNPLLAQVCPDCTARAYAVIGRSAGEDSMMAPPAVKADPKAARGLLCAGVLRDGDWNIALKFAGDNEIPNNPDETTYDPNAINWLAAESYTKAAELYATGACEERPVVGTVTTKRVCVDCVVTWTPGDVTVAQKRGGLVRIASTKEYRWQMGTTVIGVKRWVEQHRDAMLDVLEATYEAGARLKADPLALRHAMELSAAVYQEETPQYWERYFRGVTETDAQGLQVELGGSAVNDLADGAYWFGLLPGSADVWGTVYRVFGDILVAQYPRLVPSYPPLESVVDRSLVADLLKRRRAAEPDAPVVAEVPTFQPAAKIAQRMGDRAWAIAFDTGKATLRADAQSTLRELLAQLLPEGDLLIEIHGHTDASGQPAKNVTLSAARAEAVKAWLQDHAPAHFPDARLRIVAHGQAEPIASNATPDGMAKNRRVQVVVGAAAAS